MKYLLSEIRPPNCINRSVYANIFTKQKASLVLNKVNQLEFYVVHTESEEPSLELKDSLTIDESLLAVVPFQPPQLKNEWLMVLTESNSLFYIGYNQETENFVRINGAVLNGSGQQQLLDVDPIILSKFTEQSGYFIVHCFQGMIQLLVLNKDTKFDTLLVDTTNKRGKKSFLRNDEWNANTTAIGNIVVHQMVILQNTNKFEDTLAVLYRDFQYNYSLRYYRISPEEGKLLLLTQFEEFDEPPTCIIAPKTGGLLVLTSLHIFYFANPMVNLQVKNESDNIFASRNGEQQLIVKKLDSASYSELMTSSFTNYTIIDDNRILVVTNTGMSYIIYFDSKFNGKRTELINSISLIELGMTTVASDVHHIDKNFFFASSKLSQSILFEILQQKPFINVCQFIPSSPPLLNIDTKFTGMQRTLLTCGGGYDSGEFRKVHNNIFELICIKQFGTALDTSQILLLRMENKAYHIATKDMNGKINGEYLLEGKGSNSAFRQLDNQCDIHPELVLDQRIIDGDRISVTEQGCYINDQAVTNDRIFYCKILESGTFVYLTSKNAIYMQKGTNIIKRLNLASQFKQVTGIDLVHICDNRFLLLVAFHDGSYELHMISEGSPNSKILLQEVVFDATSGISSCAILLEDSVVSSSIWLLFLSGNGSIGQVYFDLNGGVNNKQMIISQGISGLPYRFFKGKNNNIVMVDTNHIFGLFVDETNFYKAVSITEVSNINNIIFLNDEEILVSTNINKVALYSLKRDSNKYANDTIMYSNLLNTKSVHIPHTNLSIVICFENKINTINGEYKKYSYLKLIDDSSMNVVDVFEFANNSSWDLVDICMVPSGIELMIPKHSFVVLSNSPNKNEILLIVHIKKNKIKRLSLIDILGLSDSSELISQTVRLIDCDKLKFIIGGNITFIVELIYDPDRSNFIWQLLPGSIVQLPIYTLGAISTDKYIIMGDIMKGLYIGELNDPTDDGYESEANEAHIKLSMLKIRCNLDPCFLTSFDAAKNIEDQTEVIFGDSLGNLSSVQINSGNNEVDQTFAFNIGEQVNIIKVIDHSFQKQDFALKFDRTKEMKPLLCTTAVIGTVNGGLYCVSKLDQESTENIEKTLVKCQAELISYLKTLSLTNKTTKAVNYTNWLSIKDWKTLSKNESGNYIRKDAFGMFDLAIIRKWLKRDHKLNTSGQRNNSDEELLNDMKTSLKVCYKNKRLLQRLVYESSLL
ncbi:unnamed protein product [Debaryomyces tyrocola]|nr:unnamed protein product [Debaryomyces tyrocola]